MCHSAICRGIPEKTLSERTYTHFVRQSSSTKDSTIICLVLCQLHVRWCRYQGTGNVRLRRLLIVLQRAPWNSDSLERSLSVANNHVKVISNSWGINQKTSHWIKTPKLKQWLSCCSVLAEAWPPLGGTFGTSCYCHIKTVASKEGLEEGLEH